MAEGTPLERVQVVNSGARVQIPPSPFGDLRIANEISTLTIKQQCNPENSRTEFMELKEISEERNHKSKPRKRSEEIFQGRKQSQV